jgi:hypothetical protein
MNPNDLQKLLEFIKSSTDPVIVNLYNMALKQVQVNLYSTIFYIIFMLISILVCTILIKKTQAKGKLEEHDWGNEYTMSQMIIFGICGSIAVFSAFIILCLVGDLFNYIINPELAAVKILLHMLPSGSFFFLTKQCLLPELDDKDRNGDEDENVNDILEEDRIAGMLGG